MNLRREAIAGITTFFTMAYIVVVNPKILSTPGTGMAFSGVLTATVLVCFVMTLLMGVYAKLPFAVAPGMGINAFFTFTIILSYKVWWQVALGIIFWAGVLFLLISVTPVRETIAKAIPAELRIGTAAGIGIFLTFIGLKNAGMIAADPVTFVRLGELGGPALLAALPASRSIRSITCRWVRMTLTYSPCTSSSFGRGPSGTTGSATTLRMTAAASA